jgi:hypothetical protein
MKPVRAPDLYEASPADFAVEVEQGHGIVPLPALESLREKGLNCPEFLGGWLV